MNYELHLVLYLIYALQRTPLCRVAFNMNVLIGEPSGCNKFTELGYCHSWFMKKFCRLTFKVVATFVHYNTLHSHCRYRSTLSSSE